MKTPLMRPRTSRRAFILLMAAAFLLFLASLGVNNGAAVIGCTVAGFVCMAAGLAVMLAFHRCPRCRRLLPSREALGMEFCPRCGGRLEPEEDNGPPPGE